jgi:alpha-ketoglutarate-dependent taurine dioxygenase
MIWRAADLPQCDEWEFKLNADERAEFASLLEDANSCIQHLRPRLLWIRDRLETGAGVVLLRNLPIADSAESKVRDAFLRLVSEISSPLSQAADGTRIFSVRDAGFASQDPRARGPNTSKRLSFHTDRCDVIGFLCLQDAKQGGENEIVNSQAVYQAIAQERPDLLDILKQPFYYKRHSVDLGNDIPWCQQPIFSSCEGHFACSFLRVLIERAHADPALPDLSPQQIEALDFLEETAARPDLFLRFRQNPGDLLLLNNWVTLHRRTAFEDWPEPDRRRHILRAWLAVPNSRPLDPMFAANYGDVRAGAIRGGMRARSTPS